MSEPNEREILAKLEGTTNWDSAGVIEIGNETLLSLEPPCIELVDAYESHLAAVGLTSAVGGEEFMQGCAQVAALVERDCRELAGVILGSIVQTRGEGLCLVFDESGRANDLVQLTNDTRIRGTVAGIDIYPVPTDYALITEQYDSQDAYEPRLCLVIEQSNIGDYDDVASTTGIVSIPLQRDGICLDLVVAQ